MNTRQYPRTLQQAFGPYTSNQIVEPKQPMDWQDKLVYWGAAVTLISVVAIKVFL